MTAKATVHELKSNPPTPMPSASTNQPAISIGFGDLRAFEFTQRVARIFAESSLVPKEFVGNLANCAIALNMASRMGADPIMIMQNLYIVHGRPSWSAQFIIAMINNCGRFSPLRFDISEDKEERVIDSVKIKNKVCIAWSEDRETGLRLESAPVSLEMAIKEGWYTKNGSKWRTMPDVMLRYRSAAFFGRVYCPDILMGIKTTDEVHDTYDLIPAEDGSYSMTVAEARPESASEAPKETPAKVVNQESTQQEAAQDETEAQHAEAKPDEKDEDDETGPEKKKTRLTKEEREQRRFEAIHAVEAAGLDLAEVEIDLNAFASNWNSAQCERAFRMAEEAAAKQKAERQEQGVIFCPKIEADVISEKCPSCPEYGKCPSTETDQG
ncbi:hypothetical protein [Desulfovibrio inopinatus]|uniref:hypothetical protein n=1 Tax=Desulfovibrio inopinatus TaxID=102109 RepID=UPI00041FCF13|nr:hypothetical protein [Desulfovibrio inopinatus]